MLCLVLLCFVTQCNVSVTQVLCCSAKSEEVFSEQVHVTLTSLAQYVAVEKATIVVLNWYSFRNFPSVFIPKSIGGFLCMQLVLMCFSCWVLLRHISSPRSQDADIVQIGKVFTVLARSSYQFEEKDAFETKQDAYIPGEFCQSLGINNYKN